MKWFILWYLTIISLIACFTQTLKFEPTFPYAYEVLGLYGNRVLTTLAHFDGVHYLTIATKGYVGTGLIQAFFPLYPVLINLLSLKLFNPIITGILISAICWYWIQKQLKFKTKILLLSFPTAFYFAAMYTESLFLALTLLTLKLAANKSKWAYLSAYLTGLTRLPGFLLSILLYQSKLKLLIIMPVVGLLSYCSYLAIYFGDPFLFAHVQNQFGASRFSGLLIPIITPFYRYAKMLLSVPIYSWGYYVLVSELLITILGLVMIGFMYKRGKKKLAIFALSSLVLPTLSGTFSSMPRYILVIWPIFDELGARLNGKWFWAVVFIFALLQIINLALFTQGKWVA